MPISPNQLAELLDRHWGPLIAWVGDASVAEDAVQQAFIALSVETTPPDQPAAWLFRVAKNKAINLQRQSKRRRRRLKWAAVPEVTHISVEASVQHAEVLKLLKQLPDEQREILVARIWGGFGFEQIATLQKSSKATVWRKYEAAIKTLREIYNVQLDSKQRG